MEAAGEDQQGRVPRILPCVVSAEDQQVPRLTLMPAPRHPTNGCPMARNIDKTSLSSYKTQPDRVPSPPGPSRVCGSAPGAHSVLARGLVAAGSRPLRAGASLCHSTLMQTELLFAL